MELLDHLAELRTRIFRAVVYLLLGMVLTYQLYPLIFEALRLPLASVLKQNGELIVTNIPDAFILRMQICFVSGLLAAAPFVVMELWGFISPALTDQERKPIVYLAPFSVLLFLAGVVTGYVCLPVTFEWMGGFISDIPGARLMQNAQDYVLLTLKVLLGFGVSFQLPLILLFLARVGLITADMMTRYWRHAVVGIAAFAAVLTPATDPLSMLMMTVPMSALYLVSIYLVRAFQPREDGTRSLSFATMLIVALAPVCILGAGAYWIWFSNNGPAVAQTGKPTAVASPAPQNGVTGTPGTTGADGTAGAVADPVVQQQLERLKQQNQLLQEQVERLNRRLDALERAGQGNLQP